MPKDDKQKWSQNQNEYISCINADLIEINIERGIWDTKNDVGETLIYPDFNCEKPPKLARVEF